MRYLAIIAFVLIYSQKSNAQFSQYFEDKTLRLDYYHCGNSVSEQFFFDELIQEPFWAGSKTKLIDSFKYGTQLVEVRTANSSELIYSRGYSTLFNEWQTTPEAKITSCCYPEGLIIPFPK
jgi:hypothetical protein